MWHCSFLFSPHLRQVRVRRRHLHRVGRLPAGRPRGGHDGRFLSEKEAGIQISIHGQFPLRCSERHQGIRLRAPLSFPPRWDSDKEAPPTPTNTHTPCYSISEGSNWSVTEMGHLFPFLSGPLITPLAPPPRLSSSNPTYPTNNVSHPVHTFTIVYKWASQTHYNWIPWLNRQPSWVEPPAA